MTANSSTHARVPSTPSAAGASSAGMVDPFFQRVLTPSQQGYIREFTSWSSARLEREPGLLVSQAESLQKAVEELALGNYPTFLRTHHVLQDAHAKLRSIDTGLAALHRDVLPALQRACESFTAASPALLDSAASQRTILAEQSFLLELLEVPNLMDTCFKNNLINEALQLDLYVKELVDKMAHRAAMGASGAAASAEAGGNAAAASGGEDALSAAPAAPAVPSILLRLSGEMEGIKRNIVRQLLAQLRGPLNVETGFPIVGLLKRTLDIFATSSSAPGGAAERGVLLKYQFLLSRNAFFEAALRGIQPPPAPAHSGDGSAAASAAAASGSASSSSSAAALAAQSAQHNAAMFKYLDEYLYLSRTNLFDIITLYSALFLDHDEPASSPSPAAAAAGASSPGGMEGLALTQAQQQQREDLGLLCRWIHLRIDIMMQTIQLHLPSLSDGGSLLALLQSCMEYGARLSRSKVGLDFRPMLPPLFCGAVQGNWARGVDRAAAEFDAHLAGFAWRIPGATLAKMGITVLQQTGENAPLQPMLSALLPHPPLALAADAFVAATNQLAKCAPLQCAPEVGKAAQRALQQVGSKIRSAQLAQGGSAVAGVSSGDAVAPSSAGKLGPGASGAASASSAGCSSADLLELGRAYRDALVPLVHRLLLRVYPHATGILDVDALQRSMADMFEEERAAAEAQEQQQQQQKQAAAAAAKAAQAAQQAAADAAAAAAATTAPVAALDSDTSIPSVAAGDTQPAAAVVPSVAPTDAPTSSAAVSSFDPSLPSPSSNSAAAASAVPPSPAAATGASPFAAAAGSVAPFASGLSFSAHPAAAASSPPAAASSFDDANDPFAIAAAKIDAQRTGAAISASPTASPLPATAVVTVAPSTDGPPLAASVVAATPEDESEAPSVDELLAGW